MLKDHFGDSIEGNLSDYENDMYREGSRLCVDADYPKEEKRQIVNSLLLAMMIYCKENGAIGIVGLMHPKILKATWSRLGQRPSNIGPAFDVGNNGHSDPAQAHVAWAKPENIEIALSKIEHPPPTITWH